MFVVFFIDVFVVEFSFVIVVFIGIIIFEIMNCEYKKVMVVGMVGIIIGVCGVVIFVVFFVFCCLCYNGNLNLKLYVGKLVRLYDLDRDDDEEDFRDSYVV